MGERADVWQGTLAFMVLKTLSAGATARVRDCAPDRTDSGRPDGRELRDVYPALLKLEQEGSISEWGTSDNIREAKYHKLRAQAIG
jgi:PadR family transcriptional regulator, regulatory protein PadR